MDLAILGIVIGGISLLVVYLSARLLSQQRQAMFGSEDIAVPVNLASVNDAVVSARVGGQVTFINEEAKKWFGFQGIDADLWLLSQKVEPAEAFLELFATEGQATFSILGRTVNASSHRVAVGEAIQFVVVMREEVALPTLEKQDRDSTKALQVISEVGKSINSHLDLEPTLDASLKGIARLIDYDAAQVTLWDQETETLRPAIRLGSTDYIASTKNRENIYRLGKSYTGWIAQRRRALLVTNVDEEEEIQLAPQDTKIKYGSFIGVPLNVRNRFLGTVEIIAFAHDQYDREDLALLNLIAEQIAIAIDNARLYSHQADRVAELSGLQKIAEAISVLQDPYQLFAQLGQRVAELMGTEMAGVLLWDEDSETLIAQKPLHGVEDTVTVQYSIDLERGSPARSLWEDVKFWFSNNVMEDHLANELGLNVIAEMTGVRTTAMATMIIGDEKTGVLQVSNRRDGRPFSLEDIRLLQIYADQAAIVVESGRLYGEGQSRVAELEGLQQITSTMSSFTNPEELYGQLTERISELVGVDICGILLYDTDQELISARTPFRGLDDSLAENFEFSVSKRGLRRELWRDSDLFVSNNAMTDNAIDSIGIREIVRDGGMQTLMFAPLTSAGRRFGLLSVANKVDRTDFNDDDRRLISIFAGQAAALIENARLYQDTDATLQKRAAELRSVSRINRELNATLELERILDVIASEALHSEGADHSTVVMFEWTEDGQTVIPDMRFGSEVGEAAHVLEKAVARGGEVIEIGDFDKVDHYPRPLPDVHSALIVPIHFEGKVVGAISLYSNKIEGLTASAREYVQALSSQATSAVTNATRHAEQVERSELLRRRAEQMSKIFELGRMFRSDQSIEDNLGSVAQAIKESVGFDRVIIGVMNEALNGVRPITHIGLTEAAFQQINKDDVSWGLFKPFVHEDYQISGSYLVPASASGELIDALGITLNGNQNDNGNGTDSAWVEGDLLLIPLMSTSDETMGILVADNPGEGQAPSRNTIELLEIFGNQAAIIVENSRLYRSVEERAEELGKSLSDLERSYTELDKLSNAVIRKEAELSQVNDLLNVRAARLLALHRIMESVDTSNNPDEVLVSIADSVVDEMDVDQCMIVTSHGHGEPLKVVAKSGKFASGIEFEEIISGADPVSISHIKKDAILVVPGEKKSTSTKQFMQATKSETLACIPMQLGEKVEGVMVLGSTRPGAAFGDDDRDLFNLLASQVSVEYENANLYEAVQAEAATAASERDRLQQLHVITTALQQTSSLEDRLAVIARGIRSVGWEQVAVGLLNSGNELGMLAVAGYDNKEEAKVRKAIEKTKIWDQRYKNEIQGLQIGSSYYLAYDNEWVKENVSKINGRRGPRERDNGHWHIQDQLYLPMFSGTDIIGVINLRNPNNGMMPTEPGLRPLELFVQQASSALENARLYTETLGLKSYNEAVVESIQQGIVVVDTSYNIESANHYIQENYPWEDKFLGQSIFNWLPVLKKMGLTEDLLNSVRGGKPIELNNLDYQADDEARILNLYAYPRYDEDTVAGIVILLEDITQRARLEQDIARRGQQLAALNEVSQNITATLQVPAVVSSAVEEADAILRFDRIAMWIKNPGTDAFELMADKGYSSKAKPPEQINPKKNILFGEIVEEQSALLVNDTREDPRFEGQNQKHYSWLGAPMISGGNLLGILVVEKSEAHTYAPADAQVAAAFGNQVAVALENARLFEEVTENATELAQRTQRLGLLNRISSTIGRSLDQSSILQTAVDELCIALNAPQGSVIIFDREARLGRLSIQYPSNPDGSVEEIVIPLMDNPIIQEIQEEKTPIAVENIAKDKRVAVVRSQLEQRGVKSVLIAPLIVGNSIIGVITIDATDEPRTFTEEQIELTQTITNQVAVSIQNARLFGETVARQRELGILFEAGRIASASLDLQTVVSNAAGYFLRAVDVTGCTVSIWDENRDALFALVDLESSSGSNAITEDHNLYNLSEYAVLSSVVKDRGAIVLSTENSTISEKELDYLKLRNIGSVLLIPLVAREETIGLVELWSRDAERRFTQSEIRLTRALAASVATSMENARLHDETQQRLDELSTINEFSRALTQTISAEDLYHNLQGQLERVFNSSSMVMAQVNGGIHHITYLVSVQNGQRVTIESSAEKTLYSHVIERGEPTLIPRDIKGYLNKHGLEAVNEELKSFMAVPLFSGDQAIGVLAVEDYNEENFFSETDLRVLNPIASQVAISLENTRLYGELEKRLSETTSLQEVSRVVNSALDLKEIFARVVSELAAAFRYPQVGLFTLENENLVLQAYHGYEVQEIERLRSISTEEGIIGRAVTTSEPQFVMDVDSDPDYIRVTDWIRSMVVVPIVSDNFVLGVLAVHSGAERALGINDLQLLRTFAGQVATAMANANLYTQMVQLTEQLEQRVEERTAELKDERDRIDTLFRITVELTASLDLDRVLNRALQLVGEAIGAEHGSLFLVDPQSDMLIYRAAMSDYEIIPPGGKQIEIRRDEGMAGWVMQNRRSLIVDNVQLDDRWSNVPGTENRRSLLGAPLLAQDEILGCLFFNSDTIAAFNDAHLQLVEAAANQVATSINNAELYRLIRDQAERLGVMLKSQQTEAAKSQAILESIADGVMVSDSTGEIILFNAASERILDLRRDEVLGRPATDLTGLYGTGATAWADMLREWTDDPTNLSSEEYLTAQLEIGSRHVSVHVSPVIHGIDYLGLVSVFRDISREVAADRAKSEFVANVSHELRTPMTSIKGYADLLLLEAAGSINDDQRRFLQVIKNNADRLTSLVNDLLTISSIEQHEIELEVRPIDMAEVISDVLLNMEARMRSDNRDIAIIKHLPDEMQTVEGDYDRVTQIVANLVENAYQYTPEGEINITVEQDDRGMTVHVADNGIGIPEAQQKRVFERFFRGVENPVVMATAGTGLGLSIVKHLIDMHSGDIWFTSEEGEGTTFSVWLPYVFGGRAE